MEEILGEMGIRGSVPYPVTADSGASQANPDRVYIGASYVTHFTDGMKVQVGTYATAPDSISDTPLLVEQGEVLSVGTDYLQLTAGLAHDYPSGSTSVLFAISKYTEATCLKWSDVDKRIQNFEDYVDSLTHHTWKVRAYREYYNMDYTSGWYSPYSGRRAIRSMRTGTYGAVYFRNTPVLELDETADTAYTGYPGDSIVVWYQDEWTEILNNADPYGTGNVDIWTQGRETGGDYWVDYADGIITFRDKMPDASVRSIILGYRAGENTTRVAADAAGAGDIGEACKMLVKRALLLDMRFVTDFPGANDAIALTQAISAYRKDAEGMLRRHVEMGGSYERH